MKYFLRILLVLVVAVAAVYGVYQYNNSGDSTGGDNITTVTKAPATEKNGDRVLLAQYGDEFKLYKSGNIVILNANGKDYEFENWSSDIDAKEPELYYEDFDADDEKELAVRAVSDVKGEDYTYNLYFLDPEKDDNGDTSYNVTVATRSTWSEMLEDTVLVELSQLKSCNKIGQLAMNYADDGVSYNKDTGIVTKGHSGYFGVLQDGGNYLTIDGWSKGDGIYTIDKNNKINLDIDVNVTYKGSAVVQKAGKIHMQLNLQKNGGFLTAPKSLKFVAYDEYKVSDPTTVADKAWSFTENNSNKAVPGGSATIGWINHKINYDSTVTTQTVNYSTAQTDINGIEKIVLTDKNISLTAKKGCTFDNSSAGSGHFSVIINEGTKSEYSIAYKASVDKSGAKEVLTISFDKSYPQSEIKTVSVNYGTK